MNTRQELQVPFIDLTAQRAPIADEINEAIATVLRRNDFILGQAVGRFETEFAAFCEMKYAVGVDSGTSALELALLAYEIGPGDEVITAANTFIATVLAISHVGATPVLVDIDPEYFTLDVAAFEAAITPRTKAVIPVHLYGQPANMDPILDIAQQHNLVVIEDACQAHGARYKDKRAGSMGHAAAFSFYPAKNLGAYGDGGLVVTHDENTADRIRMLRDYGQRQKYHHELRGFNRRLDTLQAAVLGIKLPHLDAWNTARRRHADQYTRLFANANIITPRIAPYAEPVWHLYVIRVNARDAIRQDLSGRGISTGIHYPIPIHLQPAYQDLGYRQGDFPITEQYAGQIISLPMYAEMTAEMVEYVVEMVKECVLIHEGQLSGP